MKHCKVVKFGDHYYLGLTIPRWPSKAFDHMVGKGGLNFTAGGTRYKTQIDMAALAITRKCSYECEHCYEYFNLGEKDVVPIEVWKDTIKKLQQIGVSIIALSGGEPMLRYDGLLELIESADKNLSDIHLETSGHLVTEKNALELKKLGVTAAGVALDHSDPKKHDDFRKHDGAYEDAIQALCHFNRAGVFTYTNLCLTSDLIRSGNLRRYLDLVKNLNVGIIRFLEPKPCGGYLFINMEDLFSEEDKKAATEFFAKANLDKEFSDYPLISYEVYYESPGRLGCLMGGLSHFHIDSLGNVTPCPFLPISFGNIMEEDFLDIYSRMKDAVKDTKNIECPAFFLSTKIRNWNREGESMPIPYGEIEKEWNSIFENAV